MAIVMCAGVGAMVLGELSGVTKANDRIEKLSQHYESEADELQHWSQMR